MIREIEVKEIRPHPNNPREELGDLTELADSIRSFGIMQNLTVVPNESSDLFKYTVIIGHRRLAAAKAAGLETVPCKIADMDEALQIETMLMENMQRSDLTPLEEAKGFQMMLDLGTSIADICKKTGLSETKVRHRVKLNELDEEVLREKLVEQISINDLIKLEQVHDINKRNDLLKEMGTNNFGWALQRAISEQQSEELKDNILSAVSRDAIKPEIITTNTWEYKFIASVTLESSEEEIEGFKELVKETASAEPCYLYVSNGYVSFYVDKKEEHKDEKVDPEEEERKAKEAERKKQLSSVYTAMVESWTKFIGEVKETTINENKEYIETKFLRRLVFGYGSAHSNILYQGLGEEPASGTTQGGIDIIIGRHSFHRIIVAALITSMIPNGWESPVVSYDGSYSANGGQRVSELHTFIKKLGYKVSDEEQAIADGTHELYKRL